MVAILLILMFVFSLFSNTFSFPGFSGTSNITASTIEREPLPDGSVNETDYYTDETGWIDNQTVMVDGLRHFYNETGVQPHVFITDNVNGSVNPSLTDVEEYAFDLYDELFTDEAHLLFLYVEPNADEYMTYYVTGTQARSVIDSEAGDILLDYVDRYYYDTNMTYAEFFSQSFRDAGDRIMEVTRSPWITVFIIFGVVVLAFLLYIWWKRKQESKEREAKRTEEMLDKPLSTFGNSETDELSKKYDNHNEE